MHIAHITQAMMNGIQILCGAKLQISHRVIENETRTTDQMAMSSIVDTAIVAEIVEKTTRRIDTARMIKRHGVADMRAQEIR